MSARDDYPEAAGPTLAAYVRQHALMCDEIDRLRESSDALVAEHQRLVSDIVDLVAERARVIDERDQLRNPPHWIFAGEEIRPIGGVTP